FFALSSPLLAPISQLSADDNASKNDKIKPRMKNKKSLASVLVTLAFILVAAAYVLINPSTPAPPTPSNATPIATDFAAPTSNLDAIPAALHVELFSFPETDEKVLLDRIANAKSRVWMKMYLLTDFRVVDA